MSIFSYIFTFFFLLANSAHAQNDAPPAEIEDLNAIFSNLLRIIIPLISLASLGMLLYGGYRYLSAGADKQATTLAQQTLTYALGGLIISLSAWVILGLIGTFLGINVTVFDICINRQAGACI